MSWPGSLPMCDAQAPSDSFGWVPPMPTVSCHTQECIGLSFTHTRFRRAFFSGETLVDEHVKTVLRMVAHRSEVMMNRPFAAFGEQAFAYRGYREGTPLVDSPLLPRGSLWVGGRNIATPFSRRDIEIPHIHAHAGRTELLRLTDPGNIASRTAYDSPRATRAQE